MKTRLPILSLKGSTYQKGRKHGKRARPEIENNLEVYFRRFKSETELSHDLAISRAAKFLEVINRVSPEYAETMKGVADGSAQDILDITALNVRYELMYSQFSKIGLKPLPKTFGCTAFATLPTTVENGHLIMAQNWDWIPQVKGLFLKERNENGPNVLSFTEAGVVVCEIGPDRGAVGHTNHFSNPKILGVKQVVDEERLSTIQRYRRIQKLLNDTVRTGHKLDLAEAQSMLRDHYGEPESICRHNNLK